MIIMESIAKMTVSYFTIGPSVSLDREIDFEARLVNLLVIYQVQQLS